MAKDNIMKITKTQLRRIIKEELNRSLHEGTPTKDVGDATAEAVVEKFKAAANKAMVSARKGDWSSAKTHWTAASMATPDAGGVLHSNGEATRSVDELLNDLNKLGSGYFDPQITIS